MNQVMALKGVASVGAARGAGYAPLHRPAAPIALEIRPLSACAEIAEAWSHLAGRALEAHPFAEPGFLLAASQHLVAFRDVVTILAWQGSPNEPQRRLLGFIPVFPRQGLFLPDALIGFGDRRIVNGAPLLDREQAGAVIAAVLDPGRQRLLEGRGLILRAIDRDAPLASTLAGPGGTGLVVRFQPAPAATVSDLARTAFGGLREALAQRGKLALVEPRGQAGLRDATEIILAMEASGPRAQAGQATLQDTREVGFLRAMTRGLSRARQCRIALLMLDDQPIAGAIVLGRGTRSWLYLAAQDETHAALQPLPVLLAMMRQAAPARTILLPGGQATCGDGALAMGDLHVLPKDSATPRDLAGRARAALRRSLGRLAGSRLKPPRAGAA